MEPYLGQIQVFGFTFMPRDWRFCDGSLLSIAQNTALFSLIGTYYGGNGQTTFGLPDLRGRTMRGQGTGQGLPQVSMGEISGAESTTLTLNNIPPHIHTAAVGVNTATGTLATSTSVLAANPNSFNEGTTSGAVLNGVSVSNTGNGASFPIRSPYMAMNICIAVAGIFPSRN